MVGVRASAPLCISSTYLAIVQQRPVIFRLFSSSSYNPKGSSLSSHTCLQWRSGFRAFAVKKRMKDEGGVLERDTYVNGGYEFEENEYEDDEEEGLLLPMEKMKQWLENRPAGFGQGKAYDTTVEDKLLEEMQQSRIAQLANINRLKHNPIHPNGTGGAKTPQKVPEVVTLTGVRVRLLNLPKKKNIHRDLQVAFKDVPGILCISPAVTGTKKTRDPICKGYGFVYFKSEEHANRFIQMIATANITFGKVQKQIKCEMASPSSDDDALDIPATNTTSKSSLPVLSYHEKETIITKISSPPSETLEEVASDKSSDSDEYLQSDASYYSDDEIPVSPEPETNNTKPKSISEPDKSFSTKQETKPPAKKKAVIDKAKGPKPSKLGSANKLKSKDKSLLTGVFSKYGANAKPDK